MTKLSDTQLVILSAASQREDGAVIIPDTLKGSAAEKVISALARRQLIEVVPSGGKLPVWRESEDGQHLSLKITNKGLEALGIEADDQDRAADEPGKDAETARPAVEVASPKHAEGGAPREGSKQALVLEMLGRPEGSTVEQIMTATGWQAHSIRGFLSGIVKKKLGLPLTSEPTETGRVYRITATQSEAR